MTNKSAPFIFHILLLTLLSRASAANQSLPDGLNTDSCKVWVIFTDKPQYSKPAQTLVSPRSLARRAAVGFTGISFGDYPVSVSYVDKIKQLGGRTCHVVSWINGASFYLPAAAIASVKELPFVKAVLPVRRFVNRRVNGALKKTKQGQSPYIPLYGSSYEQLLIIAVPQAQHYITQYRKKNPGEGVVIGLFDSGFLLDHACFNYLKNHNSIIADSDFVDNDRTVNSIDLDGNSHGSQTLALIAGYDPGNFIGVAWGARFALARTENDSLESHTEEDNWAAAMEWAEQVAGVDIVSSSVGYNNGFMDSATVVHNGITVTVQDYPYDFLDGKTTIISIVADSAVHRGVVVVNSAGNEAHNYTSAGVFQPQFRTLIAPADVEGVISVGAINSDGSIAGFSSLGPTADGRIKPDLVAPGVAIKVPDLSGNGDGYLLNSGTSFSAPLVAGICALISQSAGTADESTVKQLLYNSCRFLPFQQPIDSVYGRGIPNACTATLQLSEVYFEVQDSSGNCIQGALFRDSTLALLATTDSLGAAVVDFKNYRLPIRLTLDNAEGNNQSVTVDSTRRLIPVFLEIKRQIWVTVLDQNSKGITGSQVFWKKPTTPSFHTANADSAGNILINLYTLDPYIIHAGARGYISSPDNTITCQAAHCSLSVTLEPVPPSGFLLYPTVLHVDDIRLNPLKVEFVAERDNPRQYNQLVKAYIRSMNGTVIWEKSFYTDEYQTVSISVNCQNTEGRTFVPGMYLFILDYGGKKYMRKFLITG